MKIGNLTFPGYVFGQSGIQGFFGEGDEYPHHGFYKYIPGFGFDGMVLVAKTSTLPARIYPESSNTKLVDTYKVADFCPPSIWWSFKSIFNGYLLNAVGLANPGIAVLLGYGKWQQRHDPFQISVMLMEKKPEDRLAEARALCTIIHQQMMPQGKWLSYAVQINWSCPNTGHEQSKDVEEIISVLQLFRQLLPGVPLIPKFDLLVEPETISKLKPYCDAFCIANTIPFGKKQEQWWWRELFETEKGVLVSPLEIQLEKHADKKGFPGGLSGAPLFQVLVEWLHRMESFDSTVTIIAGGGIMKKEDIKLLSKFRIVRGIALGSVAILRPWRLKGLIRYGNKIFSER